MIGGSHVAMVTVNDLANGTVSGVEKYLAAAAAGSITGFVNGAAGIALQGAKLGVAMGVSGVVGTGTSALSQWVLNGEVDWTRAVRDGMFDAALAGVFWAMYPYGKGGGEWSCR